LTPILLLHTAHMWIPSDQPYDTPQAVPLARLMTACVQPMSSPCSAARVTPVLPSSWAHRSTHRQRRRQGCRRSYSQASVRSASKPPSSTSLSLPLWRRPANRREPTGSCVIPTIYSSAGACRIRSGPKRIVGIVGSQKTNAVGKSMSKGIGVERSPCGMWEEDESESEGVLIYLDMPDARAKSVG